MLNVFPSPLLPFHSLLTSSMYSPYFDFSFVFTFLPFTFTFSSFGLFFCLLSFLLSSSSFFHPFLLIANSWVLFLFIHLASYYFVLPFTLSSSPPPLISPLYLILILTISIFLSFFSFSIPTQPSFSSFLSLIISFSPFHTLSLPESSLIFPTHFHLPYPYPTSP